MICATNVDHWPVLVYHLRPHRLTVGGGNILLLVTVPKQLYLGPNHVILPLSLLTFYYTSSTCFKLDVVDVYCKVSKLDGTKDHSLCPFFVGWWLFGFWGEKEESVLHLILLLRNIWKLLWTISHARTNFSHWPNRVMWLRGPLWQQLMINKYCWVEQRLHCQFKVKQLLCTK